MDEPADDSVVRVQPLLRAACEAMAVGELVHTEAFSLFEAMSAVEIGNPKMDVAAGPRASQEPLEERPLQLELSQAQLLSVMDQLLCLEAAWHSGSSLAQTVYSSLYMMQIPRLSGQPALSAYCQAVQALCQQVNTIIIAGCVCEEEDFNPSMVGLPIADAPAKVDKCLAALSMAVDMQHFQARGQDTSTSANGHAAPIGSRKGSAPAAPSSVLSDAVVSRLQLRRYLHQALAKLQLKHKPHLDQASKLLLKALAELEAVRASAHLASGEVLGYDELLNAHVTPAAPPRNVQPKSVAEALDYFEALIQQLMRVCTVTTVSDYDGLKAFVDSFAAAHPCAVARSALHIQLAPKSWEAEVPPAWAPSEAMLMSVLHIDERVRQGGGLEGGADVELFLEQALIAVGNWCQSMLLNRCRQRRRLRRGLDDWGHLYQHALNADCTPVFQQYLHQRGWHWVPEAPDDPQGPLASWVEKETALHMLSHLMLGFELELYEPAEFTMLYWYCDYLFSIAIQDRKAVQEARPQQPANASTPGSSKPGKKSKGGAARQQQQQQQQPPQLQQQAPGHLVGTVLLDCARQLCQGMLRLVIGLSMIGALETPTLPYNTELQRFDQRFAYFHVLSRPDPLLHDQFRDLTSTTGCKPEKLFQLAADAFSKARQGCMLIKADHTAWGASEEQIQQLAVLERVAMQNLVAVTLLLRVSSGNSLPKPSFQFNQHRWFPVMVLRTGSSTARTT